MENPLIIDTPKNLPTWIRIRDLTLTTLLWLLYLYLIKEVFFVIDWLFFDFIHHESRKFPGTLIALGWYLFIIAINGVIFVGWARYNQFRFRGRERRLFSDVVSVVDLAQLYEVPVEKVVAWQQARVLTMRHDEDGILLEVLAPFVVGAANYRRVIPHMAILDTTAKTSIHIAPLYGIRHSVPKRRHNDKS